MKYPPIDASTSQISIDGATYDYFCGCGYHGFQDSPEIRKAAMDSMQDHAFKLGAAHYGYGTSPIGDKFRSMAEKFFNSEAIYTYPSGYMGNTILLRALDVKYDKIFVDQESHYSMKDALILSGKPWVTFHHLDSADLQRQIAEHLMPEERPLIASDGVFPVSGKIAPLPDYLAVLESIKGALMVIDDSHATGVLGKHGRGTYEYYGLNSPILHYCGTMSKALGAHGGIIPCSQEIFRAIKATSNIDRGSTSIPNATLVAAGTAMGILMEKPEMLERLQENALYLKEGFRRLGFDVDLTPGAICCLSAQNHFKLADLAVYYKQNFVLPNFFQDSAYTSVPRGGGIKFTIMSSHTIPQLDRVLQVTEAFLQAVSQG